MTAPFCKWSERIPNEPENMFYLPDTQEAIVSQAQFDRVQELRKNKRRPAKAERSIRDDKKKLEQAKKRLADLDAFIALTQKYVDVEELTQTIVNEYIKKIIVYAPDKSSGKRKQKVKIFFNFVDDVDIPVISEPIITQTTYEHRKTA